MLMMVSVTFFMLKMRKSKKKSVTTNSVALPLPVPLETHKNNAKKTELYSDGIVWRCRPSGTCRCWGDTSRKWRERRHAPNLSGDGKKVYTFMLKTASMSGIPVQSGEKTEAWTTCGLYLML